MTTPDEKTFATLTKLFEEEFGPIGDRQVLYVHAPGRSEIRIEGTCAIFAAMTILPIDASQVEFFHMLNCFRPAVH